MGSDNTAGMSSTNLRQKEIATSLPQKLDLAFYKK
jgi:hypothetical protein